MFNQCGPHISKLRKVWTTYIIMALTLAKQAEVRVIFILHRHFFNCITVLIIVEFSKPVLLKAPSY